MSQVVFITGASGFIGQFVCQIFLKNGFKVIACGRQKTIGITHPLFEYHCFDLKNIDSQRSLLESVDFVVHLAALAHQGKNTPSQAYYETNTYCTKALVDLCLACDVKRFIYLSSIKVNGEKTEGIPFNERQSPAPKDDYGHSKWLAEQLIRETKGMSWVIIRPPLVYGPGVKANFANLLKLVDTKLPLPFAAFSNQRSFVSIDNLSDFIFSCATHLAADQEIFCISDDDDQSTASLVRTLQNVRFNREKMVSLPLWILRFFSFVFGKKAIFERLSESLQVDMSKAKERLNWRPRLTFKDAVESYFKQL